MPLLESVIVLAALVLLSNVISHYLVSIPVGLIQITLGFIVALIFKISIELETDWFLLLFIAPLLFNDGRKFPKRELWKLRGAIFANAILLVFLTTVAGGFFIHFLIPKMPLAVGFALAAILSPTDPVAVQSIAEKAKLPRNILNLVSGESLINDASGLIAFKYAIAAAATGYFSLSEAFGDFTYIAIVGFIAGAVLMLLISTIRDFLMRQGINDVVFNTILQILTPFIIFMFTEEFLHASGVISVVVAGVISSTRKNSFATYLPEIKLVTEKTWEIVVYLLNGFVFIILGIELPIAMSNTIEDNNSSTFTAIVDVVVVWLFLVLIRVIWTYINMLFISKKDKTKNTETPSWRVSLISGFSGVRGAITMAGVLTVPTIIKSGDAFPERSLMLFIAGGIIVLSLLAAILILPFLTKEKDIMKTNNESSDGLVDDDIIISENGNAQFNEKQARIYIMRVAISRLESERRESNQKVAYELILEYQFMIRRLEFSDQDDERLRQIVEEEANIRRIALDGELEALDKMKLKNAISDQNYAIINKKIMKQKAKLSQINNRKISFVTVRNIKYASRQIGKMARRAFFSETELKKVYERRNIEKALAKAAIKALSTYVKKSDDVNQQFNQQAIYHLIVYYRNRIETLKLTKEFDRSESEEQSYQLRLKAIAAERTAMQELMEQGYITWSLASRLREYINYSENVIMLSEED
ncbi:cation:proton antiporter [Dellaglioa algida]|uniref:Sodium:proton antiporter n=1 Tax=Dellaglioa algida TaxID=105612 RepID=A0A2C8EML3_9LACO|nr:sodium:proton antiporter [Dellaglioa algida]MDK1716909.1 sodium:proton antiporter [Dellaglioa algida]MDK1718845.1 sodium:proton antiporter [Dellaglioa algida]MDK1719683.1 sodium:proton antiporter [Dellaglioa algida]MDK1721856.1 sodium:proton antiporter [Dellaglioa algida]MDK1723026.1 sodium:proton antiporter [Dellaglioa algida]